MKKLILTSDSLRDLVFEEYLVIDGKEIKIQEMEREHDDSGRHQEYHSMVFMREDDKKYYRVHYSTSTQDSMGWDECNYGPFEAVEVVPEEVTITKYVTKK